MNEQTSETSSSSAAGDSKYFSQRAKDISLLNKPTLPSVPVKPSTEMYFQFSNRVHLSTGRGHGSAPPNQSRPNISVGRGRTTIPSSPFVLQKDNPPTVVSSSSPPTTTKSMPSPMFVMHDEVQFVRPYFGPRNSTDTPSTSISRKREILLLALKEIESGLKTL